MSHSCAFCGSTTAQPGITPFNRLIRACALCEQQQWPNKITLEAAKEKLSLHHILWPPQGYIIQWARKRCLPYRDQYTFPEYLDVLLDDEIEAVAKAIKDNPFQHTPTWAMYDLTAQFTKRLPWDLELEESQDADDKDFELDI